MSQTITIGPPPQAAGSWMPMILLGGCAAAGYYFFFYEEPQKDPVSDPPLGGDVDQEGENDGVDVAPIDPNERRQSRPGPPPYVVPTPPVVPPDAEIPRISVPIEPDPETPLPDIYIVEGTDRTMGTVQYSGCPGCHSHVKSRCNMNYQFGGVEWDRFVLTPKGQECVPCKNYIQKNVATDRIYYMNKPNVTCFGD